MIFTFMTFKPSNNAAKIKVVLIAICITVSIISAAVIQAWIDHRDTRKRNEITVSDIANVVERHLLETTAEAETVLGQIADKIFEDDGVYKMSEPKRWQQLRSHCIGLTGCKSLAVVDPSGRIVALSDTPNVPDINASDRVYFKETQQTRQLVISPAVVTRIEGNPILFGIAKAVYDPSGRFLGVVVAGIDTEHIASFFRLMNFTAKPTITVFKSNGDLVARNLDMKPHVGKNNKNDPLFTTQLPKSKAGVYEAVALFDGKERIAAYRTIEALDLVIFAGITPSDAFVLWKKRTINGIFVVSATLAVVLLLLLYGYRSLRRQVALEALNTELDRLSNLDGLTGIANRRAFDAALERAWARHTRTNANLSVLLIDVDFFKAYNDTYGHQAGDECLRQMAEILQTSLHRDVDLVARFGGEEFVVILDCDESGAVTVAERIRRAVESRVIAHVHSPANPWVTVSIGLANAAVSKSANTEELLRSADLALYEAKNQGRNRVHPAMKIDVSEIEVVI